MRFKVLKNNKITIGNTTWNIAQREVDGILYTHMYKVYTVHSKRIRLRGTFNFLMYASNYCSVFADYGSLNVLRLQYPTSPVYFRGGTLGTQGWEYMDLPTNPTKQYVYIVYHPTHNITDVGSSGFVWESDKDYRDAVARDPISFMYMLLEGGHPDFDYVGSFYAHPIITDIEAKLGSSSGILVVGNERQEGSAPF